MKTLTRALLLTLCLPAVACVAPAQAASPQPAPHQQEAPKPEAPKADTVVCTITGEEVPKGEALTSVYEGKTFYFCCGGCKKTFDKNPAKYAKPAKTKVAQTTKAVKK